MYVADRWTMGYLPLQDHRTGQDVNFRQVRHAVRIRELDDIGVFPVTTNKDEKPTEGDVLCPTLWLTADKAPAEPQAQQGTSFGDYDSFGGIGGIGVVGGPDNAPSQKKRPMPGWAYAWPCVTLDDQPKGRGNAYKIGTQALEGNPPTSWYAWSGGFMLGNNQLSALSFQNPTGYGSNFSAEWLAAASGSGGGVGGTGSRGKSTATDLTPNREPKKKQPREAAKVEVHPIKDQKWTPDKRFEKMQISIHPSLSDVPKDTPLIVISGTSETKQEPLGFPIMGNKLIAVNRAGKDSKGTVVYDLKPDNSLDDFRSARLQTAWRVVDVGMPSSAPHSMTLGWQLAETGQGGLRGWGTVYGIGTALEPPEQPETPEVDKGTAQGNTSIFNAGIGGGGSPAVPTPNQLSGPGGTGSRTRPLGNAGDSVIDGDGLFPPETPGKPKGTVVAFADQLKGSGPFEVGDPQADKHKFTHASDGAVNSLHLSTHAYFYGTSGDGPLDFTPVIYKEPPKLKNFSRVHLRWDPSVQHKWVGGDRPGKWRWLAEVPFKSRDRLPPENLVGPPPGGGVGDPGGGDGSGSGGAPPGIGAPSGNNVATVGGGAGLLVPNVINTALQQEGYTNAQIVSLLQSRGQSSAEQPAIHGKAPGASRANTQLSQESVVDMIFGNRSLDAQAHSISGRQSFPVILPPATANRIGIRRTYIPDGVGAISTPPTTLAPDTATPFVQPTVEFGGGDGNDIITFPGIGFNATPINTPATDSGVDSLADELDTVIPLSMQIAPYGSYSAGEFNLTTNASTGRWPGGTTSGGVVYLPPEVSIHDVAYDFAPPGVTLSDTSVLAGPTVSMGWAQPDPATGTRKAGTTASVAGTGKVTFSTMDASAVSLRDPMAFSATGYTQIDVLEIPEVSAPGAGATGIGRMHAESDGVPYWTDDGGTKTSMLGGTGAGITSFGGPGGLGDVQISSDATLDGPKYYDSFILDAGSQIYPTPGKPLILFVAGNATFDGTVNLAGKGQEATAGSAGTDGVTGGIASSATVGVSSPDSIMCIAATPGSGSGGTGGAGAGSSGATATGGVGSSRTSTLDGTGAGNGGTAGTAAIATSAGNNGTNGSSVSAFAFSTEFEDALET